MDLSYHLPDDIRSEFSVDENGHGFSSASGTARLAGITHQSLLDRESGLLAKLAAGKVPSEELKPFNGFDYWMQGKIPDTLIFEIVHYYAYVAKNTNDTARRVCHVLGKIGTRAFIQMEKGWKPPEPEKPIATNEETMVLLRTSQMLGRMITGNRGILCLIQEEDKFQSVAHLPLPTLPEPFSLRQWAQYSKSVTLSTPDCISLGKQVAAAMRTLKYVQPKAKMSNQRRYSYPDMPVLETAWEGWRISRMRD